MMYKIFSITVLSLTALILSSCSDDNSSDGSSTPSGEPDVVIINRIDDSTGFMVAANATSDTAVDNSKGVELNPSVGVSVYDGNVYVSGSLTNDNVTKYGFDGERFVREGGFITGENARAGSIVFANKNKAYVNTYFTPELIIFDPADMTVTKRIDLSAYALGEGDTNPNPSSGVIREGKLYLALAQIDTFQTWRCQAGASVLIIDVETDVVEKHIQDERACLSGVLEPNEGLILDELGDIYVANMGSYGYYEGLQSGYLRIKSGSEEFDPDYYFSVTNLDLPEVVGGKASYLYEELYAGDGKVYGNLFIPGLASNPPDYLNDKNFLAYRLDLRNQTVTALDIPATVGWSADSMMYGDKVMFGRSTENGVGLFFYDPTTGTNIGDATPSITTVGSPRVLKKF